MVGEQTDGWLAQLLGIF
ncbi:hypothetical protein SCAR479_06181 [Seiridium cardinale]|uniref:Uncharacterized protein n=1 Tax=Seiridium cardinale TaxID=138064 RepID=A0ABR2XTH8_9PEZI